VTLGPGGQLDLCWIDWIFSLVVQILPVPAPVGHADRQLSEERLAGFAPVPVAAVKGVLELEVEIRLA